MKNVWAIITVALKELGKTMLESFKVAASQKVKDTIGKINIKK